MSEIMRPMPFENLMRWVLKEYKTGGSVFGIRKEKFYKNLSGKTFSLFGETIATPVGPAAGPNSQLAQNILAAYLAGARFVELKTVQTMDGEELRNCVPRPCINTVDEGYNVEWSTELTVQEAFDEYVKAWFLCHVFGKEFGLASKRDFIFNMSVGYSLEGIKSPKIDAYIEGMKNASKTPVWGECCSWLSNHLGEFQSFTKDDLDAISPAVAPSITLSTLHGCPREEIEKIAHYLLTEKGLHTYIKCNPTLLGYTCARNILDSMGYNYISFDDHHFKEDLQFSDAVEMLKRLTATAAERKLSFGVKLTNTFPVDIKKGELPGNEMYMSGRSLFPLSITVAKKLAEAFSGNLAVSYSGGADFFNLASILETGILPVTTATTILKPGGYERLKQLAELAETIPQRQKDLPPLDPAKVSALAEGAVNLKRYRKEYRIGGSRKTASPLPLFDCYKAPCRDGGCPIHQRIPEYLALAAEGKYNEAFAIIAQDNTAPSITGTICDHQCQVKCARADYEDPLEIRRIKYIAASSAQDAYIAELAPPAAKTEKSVGIVGAGPAGIAAAVYLRRNGVDVTVYEKREGPYGIVSHVIPSFRIAAKDIERDFGIAQKLGVKFQFGVSEHYSLSELKKGHEFVILATGAWKEGASPVKEGKENVIDALKFLEDSKNSGLSLELGKSVAVVGGGDVAMDCARAAKRNKGVEKVTVVYRRTREFMPAQKEEIDLVLEDGVEIIELLAPESFTGGVLTCEKMQLGDYGPDGRRGIVGTGDKTSLDFDTVIGAVGARVFTGDFSANSISLNEKGFPAVSAVNESSVPGVYIAGDCRAGAATVIKAIADSKVIALEILKKLGIPANFGEFSPSNQLSAEEDLKNCILRKGVLKGSSQSAEDGNRCLRCDSICEICADVCPNRANIVIADHRGKRQIVHIDWMCNECGNCAAFCPHSGKPYLDKFTVFASEDDFNNSDNQGVWIKDGRIHGSPATREEDREEFAAMAVAVKKFFD